MRGSNIFKVSLSAALLVSMVGMVGCGNGKVNTLKTQNTPGNKYDIKSMKSNRIMGLKYSKVLSNKVTELAQVRSGQVLVTDRDAYVAVSLHGQNTGSTGYGAKSTNSGGTDTRIGMKGLGHGAGRSGLAGTMYDAIRGGTYGANGTGGTRTTGNYGATGTGSGTNMGTGYYGGMNGGVSGNSYYSYGGGTGARSNAGMGSGYGTGMGSYGTNSTGSNSNIMNSTGLGNGTGSGPINGMGNSGMSGTGMSGTGSSNMGIHGSNKTYGTGNNSGTYGSYSNTRGNYDTNSIRGNRGTNGSYGTNSTGTMDYVPQALKSEIERKIKMTAPHIQNVYISAHPEFVSRVNGYATQSIGGQALQGVENDFSTLIQRIFPSRNGTMTGPSGLNVTPQNNSRTNTNMNMTNDTMDQGYRGSVTR
ncbi:hypothetical protein J2Z69_003207 [Paenibacillus shirakamiensis]|uniref:Sporulation protein n=1 Tax=Paenibacillus shirakamiensis TaxID=1265935 RepID=A0ABS4JM11_9BACL|nr:YhcN/YlaJ family sporulation lipoprotein [Paenibacillus shirakamiensis]MBP2002150.1 hypothetical protein [Paenibacillus shirakamiensis]